MKRIVFFYILLFLCVLALFVLGVKSEVLVIQDFKGLDTRSSVLNIPKNYCRAAHEVDFSRIVGTASKRKGYTYVDSLFDDGVFSVSGDVAIDTLTSLYPAYLTNGKQSLIYSAFTRNRGGYPTGDTLGWNNIYMTGIGTAMLDTVYQKWGAYWNGSIKLYDVWPTLTETYYATFNDILYASNGVSRGMVADIDKRHSAPWPIPAPGEPRIVPVSPTPSTDTTYKMNGEYRYTFFVSYKDGATWYGPDSNGVVTRPIRCDSQQVMMFGFHAIPNNTSATPDSIRIYPYRTRANTGRLDELDSAFYTGVVLQFSAAQADSIIYIDSLPDAELDTPGVRLIDPTRIGYDTAFWMRYGAPSYLSSTDSAYRRVDSARNFIWGGGPGANMDVADTNMFPVAYGYMVTFLDTLLNIESDSSRSLFVSQQGTDKLRSIRVGLPPVPPRYTHTVRRLYRSMVLVGGRDTSVVVQTWCNTSRSELQDLYNVVARTLDPDARQSFLSIRMRGATGPGNNYYLGDIRKSGNGWCFDKLQRTVARDTLYVTPYMLVDEMKADSVAYTDSLRTDSIMQHHWYQASAPPPYLTHIFGANNRIFGIQGARLYQSRQDTIGFGAFSYVSINEDDGDVGTFARMTQRGIRFYKNASSYIVPIDPDGGISEYAPVNGIGLIAPNSGVLTPYGFAYLSGSGVMVETEGEQLERVYKSGLISGRLDNFDKIPLSVKSKAKGVYTDNKYILYVPSPIDTAYVYDFLTDAWATWSFPISGAALYGTEDVVTNLPGDTLFFYKPNSRTLYKYGGETDNGTFITTTWKSAPLLADGYVNQILGVGTWTSSDKEGALYGKVYNQSGLVDSVTTYSSDMTDRYQFNELGAHVAGLYAQISIEHTADTFFSVAGFDIHWARLENVIPGLSSGLYAGSSDSSGTGITEVVAGSGLTGGGTSGSVTVNVGGSVTITVSDNAIDVDTTIIATRGFVRDSGAVGAAPDSVLYADSSGYADTAGVALNGGSTDSIYVKRADSFNTSGWIGGDDTLFVDTTGGGGTGWNWADSSSHGPDSVLFADSSNHSDRATLSDSTSGGAARAEIADSLTNFDENVADKVGAMVTGNTETGITVTYQDADNTLDFAISETGDIEGVTAGTGLTGGGTSGAVTINFGATGMIIAGADTVALDTASLRTWVAATFFGTNDFDNVSIDTNASGDLQIKSTVGLSDSTTWNAVADDYGTGGWETGDIANGTLEPIDLNQSSKWKIDAFYGDTAVADSHYITIARFNKVADDTTKWDSVYSIDTMRVTEGELEDSLDGYTLIGHTHDSTGLVDSSVSGRDVKRATLALSHLGSSGAGNNQVPVWNGSAWVPTAQAALGNNPTIYGDLNLFGNLRNANFKRSFDTTYAYAKRADTFLNIRVPEIYIGGADSNLEKYRTAHPSVVYMPGGFGATGYRYIMANTMDLASQESPFIRVSNDGDNWTQLCITDSIVFVDGEPPSYDTFKTCTPDPLVDTLDCARAGGYALYLSDPDLLFGSDGKLWLYFRATDTINPTGTANDSIFQSIWATSTTDLLTWTTPTVVINWFASMSPALAMSPAVWVDTGSSYKMWVVDDPDFGTVTTPHIKLYEAPKADSGWTLLDTVYQYGTTSTRWPQQYELHPSTMTENSEFNVRHLDVIDNGADEKIALINVYGGGAYVGKTLDGGRTLNMRQEPFLYAYTGGSIGDLRDSAWDASGIYRPTGVIVDRNGERVMEVFYGANRQALYHTGKTILWEMKPAILDFTTVAGRRKAPTDSITLIFPSWSDSSNGRIELFVDSTNQGSDTERVKIAGIANGMFVADTLVLVYKTTVAGTGSTTTTNVRIDELALYGPDLTSSSYKPDSLYWNSTTDRAIDTVQTLKINIKTRDAGGSWDGAYPFQWENGSQITLWIKASLASDEAALHVERAYLVGRRR